MGRLEDKVAIVTGGGGGIARGMLATLAREGAALAVVELDPDRGAEAARIAEKHGARAIAIACDVTRRDQVDAAVARCVEALGGIDILINNATGVTAASSNLPFMDHDEATLDRILAVDVKGSFHFMQACFPHLRSRGAGRVINFSSGAGSERMAGFAAYAAAKEGVRALTGVAAREWGPLGITVNVVCPSAMTPGMKAWLEEHPDPKFREQAFSGTPLGRLGDPDLDIGRVVAFLASEDAGFITGQTLWVDGGHTIHS